MRQFTLTLSVVVPYGRHLLSRASKLGRDIPTRGVLEPNIPDICFPLKNRVEVGEVLATRDGLARIHMFALDNPKALNHANSFAVTSPLPILEETVLEDTPPS